MDLGHCVHRLRYPVELAWLAVVESAQTAYWGAGGILLVQLFGGVSGQAVCYLYGDSQIYLVCDLYYLRFVRVSHFLVR